MSVIFIGVDAFSKQNSFSRRFPRKPFLFDGTSADRVHTPKIVAVKRRVFRLRGNYIPFMVGDFVRTVFPVGHGTLPPSPGLLFHVVVRAYLSTVSSRGNAYETKTPTPNRGGGGR